MRDWGGIIGALILVGLILGVIQFKKSDFYDHQAQDSDYFFQEIGQNFDVVSYNIRAMFKGPRKMSGAKRLELEGELKTMFPVFQGFGMYDWRGFWKMIYKPKKHTFLEMKRWRTKSEVETFLKVRFDELERYTPKHWDAFWSVIEKDKGFKHVAYSDTMSKEDKVLVKKQKAILIEIPGSPRISFTFD